MSINPRSIRMTRKFRLPGSNAAGRIDEVSLLGVRRVALQRRANPRFVRTRLAQSVRLARVDAFINIIPISGRIATLLIIGGILRKVIVETLAILSTALRDRRAIAEDSSGGAGPCNATPIAARQVSGQL